MMKLRITKLLTTALSSAAIVAFPIKQARAIDYWDDKTITENVIDGEEVVGQERSMIFSYLNAAK